MSDQVPKIAWNGLDFQTDTYKKLQRFALERIAFYHKRLENIHCSPEETASIRGAIVELRYLSALDRHHGPGPTSGDSIPE